MCELAARTPAGAFVEIGVYKGGSARLLADVAEQQGRELHLFDTFTGMPIAGPEDSHQVGDFADTSEAAVRALIPSAHFHVGIFPATAPVAMPPIAFVHLDVDQYQSYRDAIAWAAPLMVPGGVIWFDDCGILPSADRAALEAFGERVDKTSYDKWVVRF
jgi:O-methyltransferase